MNCPHCSGDGYFTESEHDLNCSPENGCSSNCPIPVQYPCYFCDGTGEVKDET